MVHLVLHVISANITNLGDSYLIFQTFQQPKRIPLVNPTKSLCKYSAFEISLSKVIGV